MHGSIPYAELRARYRGDELCGLLAHAAGVIGCRDPVTPLQLVDDFDWARVRCDDLVARWDNGITFMAAAGD
jgi:hypothetical protein